MEALIIVAVLLILWTQQVLVPTEKAPKKTTTGAEDLANALKKFLQSGSENQNS
jgi:hypothetical protein